jgi:uncharacterized SAM-binding protein YcdF (DUF218 family)
LGVLIAKTVAALLMPPAGLLILALVGLIVMWRHRRLGLVLVVAGMAGLWILSTPPVGRSLLRGLQIYPPLDLSRPVDPAAAIVVLGGGHYLDAPEYGGENSVIGPVLERLRYAVWLHRRTGLPLLITGGSVFGTAPPESVTTARCLEEDYGIQARWIEAESRNTRENARNSARLLERDGIHHVYLVTHAWHMRRAVPAFGRAGLDVTPAPTLFLTRDEAQTTIYDFVPSISGLAMSYTALHERLGYIWYDLRQKFEE